MLIFPRFSWRRLIEHGTCVHCGWLIYKIKGRPWLHAYSRAQRCYSNIPEFIALPLS